MQNKAITELFEFKYNVLQLITPLLPSFCMLYNNEISHANDRIYQPLYYLNCEISIKTQQKVVEMYFQVDIYLKYIQLVPYFKVIKKIIFADFKMIIN